MAALRLRTDSWWDAGKWRAILRGAAVDPRLPSDTRWAPGWAEWLEQGNLPAEVGDVWRWRQRPSGPDVVVGYAENHPDWPVSHYALVCPVEACAEGIHSWHHAYDCPAGETFGAGCKRGPGRLSCWDWSGSIEAGDLTAQPSLQVLTEIEGRPLHTCGFHGFLTAGVLA